MCGLCDFDDRIIVHAVCTQCYKQHSGVVRVLDVTVNAERLFHCYLASWWAVYPTPRSAQMALKTVALVYSAGYSSL